MKYKVVSLMSGTSLDGVDIAYCEFDYDDKWSFRLIQSETVPYEKEWEVKLTKAAGISALEFSMLNVAYGEYLGSLVKAFCSKNTISPDFVSSHGHTVFHQPAKGVTVQIGSGAAIAAACHLPVVFDFRTLDVAMGGQGAPLVPIGDRLLFSDYDYCLNLGGIANISFDSNGERKAFDICACNIVLNYFASKRGRAYDSGGEMAAKGVVNDSLLKELNALEYYSLPVPKSLGREDIEKHVFPLIQSHNLSVENSLATFTKHIAEQIGKTIDRSHGKLLITGGGAFNSFLIEKITDQVKLRTIVPESNIVNYKEAIIFGFLGVLRMEKQNNCLKSVTGSIADNCGGAIIFYKNLDNIF